jgi:hypothetical protein
MNDNGMRTLHSTAAATHLFTQRWPHLVASMSLAASASCSLSTISFGPWVEVSVPCKAYRKTTQIWVHLPTSMSWHDTTSVRQRQYMQPKHLGP